MSDTPRDCCEHYLGDMETACADGLCPICLQRELAALREQLAEAKRLLREAREELFRLGEDSASAYEYGDTRTRREAERNAAEIHKRIDAHLAGRTAGMVEEKP